WPFQTYVTAVPAADVAINGNTADQTDPAHPQFSVNVVNFGPNDATGATVSYTFTGPGIIHGWNQTQPGTCTELALTLTCPVSPFTVDAGYSNTIFLDRTGPGTITETATIHATEFDPRPANNSSSASAGPPIAYVYATDTASRDAFVSYLGARGYWTNAITVAAAATTDFSAYQWIVIGDDTGSLGTWGTSAAVANIAGSTKPGVGGGEGGYAYFGQQYSGAANTIGWPNGAHGPGSSIQVVNAADTVWATPNPIATTTGASVTLYTATTNVVGIFDPLMDKGFHYIAQDAVDTRYQDVVGQGSCDLLWGFSGSPATMTATAKDLFENSIAALATSCGLHNI